jgi:hypothetical protein
MSLLVRIGSGAGAAPPGAAAAGAGVLRRRERRALLVGAGAGLLLLGAVPLPCAFESRTLARRCEELSAQVARLREEEAAARAWESGDRVRAPEVHRRFRRWFSSERRLLETRNHLLGVARSLGLRVTDVQVFDGAEAGQDAIGGDGSGAAVVEPLLEGIEEGGAAAAGGVAPGATGAAAQPGASGAWREPSLPIAAELVHVAGRGGFAEIALLAAMLSRLDPPLRLVTLELTGSGTARDFTLLAKRFYEAAGATGDAHAQASLARGTSPRGTSR